MCIILQICLCSKVINAYAIWPLSCLSLCLTLTSCLLLMFLTSGKMLLLHRFTKKVLLMYLLTTGPYPSLAFHVSYSNVLLSVKSMSTLFETIYSVANSMVSLLADLHALTFLNVLTTGPVIYKTVFPLLLYILISARHLMLYSTKNCL